MLPAVETLILLARTVRTLRPDAPILCQTKADFARLIEVPADRSFLDVSVTLEHPDTGWRALLQSTFLTPSGLTRTLFHAGVTFSSKDDTAASVCVADLEELEGSCIQVPSALVYRDLIPFGPAYRNIQGDLTVSREGALIYLSGGKSRADEALLGSPFVLDAAMHAACVWGQRYAGVVAFPVGFERRDIFRPTRREHAYLGRILPRQGRKNELMFDVWIFDDEGVLCERVCALRMRDMTGGRMKPPKWIMEKHV